MSIVSQSVRNYLRLCFEQGKEPRWESIENMIRIAVAAELIAYRNDEFTINSPPLSRWDHGYYEGVTDAARNFDKKVRM